MSEADKLFEELGYEKETYNPDVIYFTNKFIDTIYFAFNKNTKKVCFIENNQAGDISMQELQAINKKVEELRMDMILMLVILNYINDCKKIGKEKLAVSLSGRLFSYFLCVPLPIFAGLILIEVL